LKNVHKNLPQQAQKSPKCCSEHKKLGAFQCFCPTFQNSFFEKGLFRQFQRLALLECPCLGRINAYSRGDFTAGEATGCERLAQPIAAVGCPRSNTAKSVVLGGLIRNFLINLCQYIVFDCNSTTMKKVIHIEYLWRKNLLCLLINTPNCE